MTLAFHLKRNNGGTIEYLYIPVELGETMGQEEYTAPMIPGTDSTNVWGPSSPNFLIDLGKKRVSHRISGWLFPLEGEKYPTLSTGEQHIFSGATTVSGTVSGRQMRDELFKWWAAQAEGHTDFQIVWPEWDGTNDKTWEGYITQPKFSEQAATVDQVMYNFGIVIGDT